MPANDADEMMIELRVGHLRQACHIRQAAMALHEWHGLDAEALCVQICVDGRPFLSLGWRSLIFRPEISDMFRAAGFSGKAHGVIDVIRLGRYGVVGVFVSGAD